MRGKQLKLTREELGAEVEEPEYGSVQLMHKDRVVKKDELKEACDRFGLEYSDGSNVPELRKKIRSYLDVVADDRETKFGAHELRRFRKALQRTKFLEAEEVDIDAERGDTLIIDGEEHDLIHILERRMDDVEEVPYDRYERYLLDDNRIRLMVLYNLDTSECRYDKSVVLETAGDWGPYKRWYKENYVEEVEVR